MSNAAALAQESLPLADTRITLEDVAERLARVSTADVGDALDDAYIAAHFPNRVDVQDLSLECLGLLEQLENHVEKLRAAIAKAVTQ